ncbi:Transthyretin [Calocera cornea HHB12733]|uniref:Transthyretin n=1 Tax=Calocera cornea HHB12733 TaxID=1353952 RepID=A0A165E527_9BASI|nr:Transthyretin [Calocera cornea HHB12733]
MAKSPITCHVLDSVLGKPGAGIGLRVYQLQSYDDPIPLASLLGTAQTDADGRCSTLLPGGKLVPGTYKVCFDTGAYFAQGGRECFYPVVEVCTRANFGALSFLADVLWFGCGRSPSR